jgi:hypothetical protein
VNCQVSRHGPPAGPPAHDEIVGLSGFGMRWCELGSREPISSSGGENEYDSSRMCLSEGQTLAVGAKWRMHTLSIIQPLAVRCDLCIIAGRCIKRA